MSELFEFFFHYLNALWKRRWVVLICAWVVAIPGWLAVASMPSVYESSSRIYVDTSSVLQPLLRGIAVQSNVESQVQLMKQTLLSRPNLMEVARQTDYDLTATSEAQMEAMLSSLQDRTTVQSNREDIFSISFEDTDPRRARDVVQALLTKFVEGNLGASRKDLDTAEEFIDQQISDYEKRLEEAEGRLARFKQDNIDVALGNGSYLERARAANERAEKYEQDLSVAIAQRNLLNHELAGTPATMPSSLAGSGPPDDLSFRIVELEAKLRELQAQYTDRHPDVVTAQRQLDALYAKQESQMQANAEGQGPDFDPDASGVPNPVYGEIKLRLLGIDTEIENLRRRAAVARAEADALAGKAESVPQVEAEFQRLNRDYDIIKARHDELLSRRESARMSRSRETVGQEVQYRLIEPPNLPSKPTGPNRPLFLTAVLVFSLIAGGGFAFLLVLLDTSFASASDLSAFTGLQVLGSVSDTRRKKVSGFAGIAALCVSFAGLVLVFGLLLVIERQYGLDTVVTANLGPDLLNRGYSSLAGWGADLLNWLKSGTSA